VLLENNKTLWAHEEEATERERERERELLSKEPLSLLYSPF